jgi:hypothetical protein
MSYWLASNAKTIKTGSLPHPKNESQQSIDNFGSYILDNLSGDWLQTSINEVLATFRGKNNRNTLPALCRR